MKSNKIKKKALGVLVIVIVGLICGTYFPNHVKNEYPGMIRLHIIANSNSIEDQALKLDVRNALLQYMDGQENIEDARAYIDGHINEIEDISNQVIKEKGFVYTAQAQRKVTFIPEKSYEDLTLPAGNYEALKVTLGEGEGENWWCVIFPQLCLIGDGDDGEKLILKSKIKEILKARFDEANSQE